MGTLDASEGIWAEIVEELRKKIWSAHWVPGPAESSMEYSPEFLSTFIEGVIRSLQFDDMEKREQEIPEAFQTTFEWIWKPQQQANVDPQHTWSNFPDWLENDDYNLYWITGVPGAGKSTLMKYIQYDSAHRLTRHLDRWHPDSPLLTLSYYAWNAGRDESKSCEGLLRTILFQGLTAEPNLIPKVAKRRLAMFRTMLPITPQDYELLFPIDWELKELEECVECFLEELGGRRKLMIFVDGLDEFAVPPHEIVAQIQQIRTGRSVKLCVASRPWIEFQDAFGRCSTLRIHELTNNDISTYVEKRLEVLPAFVERKDEVGDLTKQIREKARGVFLWVSIVVKHVLPGLVGGKSLASLQQAIDDLPVEIEELYNLIWTRIPSDFKEEASRLFQLFRASFKPDMLVMWVAYEGKSATFRFEPQSGHRIKPTTLRRINSHARGILQLNDRQEITVTHRTAYEWMYKEQVWGRICANGPPFYNPHLHLMNGWLACSSYLTDGDRDVVMNNTEGLGFSYLDNAAWHASAAPSLNVATVTTGTLIAQNKARDDVVECFREFEKASRAWRASYDHTWAAWTKERGVSNFTSFAARVGAAEYLQDLKQCGRLAKCINSFETGDHLDITDAVRLGKWVFDHGTDLIYRAHLESKLRCVQLCLDEMVDTRPEHLGKLADATKASKMLVHQEDPRIKPYGRRVLELCHAWAEERGCVDQLNKALGLTPVRPPRFARLRKFVGRK